MSSFGWVLNSEEEEEEKETKKKEAKKTREVKTKKEREKEVYKLPILRKQGNCAAMFRVRDIHTDTQKCAPHTWCRHSPSRQQRSVAS